MRWISIAIVAVFVLAILIFALQNVGLVTISFLGISARAPLAVLAIIIYIAGALTGGGLYALIRQVVKGSRRAPVR